MNSYEKFLKENFGNEYDAVYSAIRRLNSPSSIDNFLQGYVCSFLSGRKLGSVSIAEISERINTPIDAYVSDHYSNEPSLKKAEKWQKGLEFVLSKTE